MKSSAIAGALLLLLYQRASGAGIALYETGAPDLGTASAGRAAMAADASTVATNPAGMTLLDRTQLMITSGAMLPAINFDRGPKTDVPGGGGGGGNAGVFFPIRTFGMNDEDKVLSTGRSTLNVLLVTRRALELDRSRSDRLLSPNRVFQIVVDARIVKGRSVHQ